MDLISAYNDLISDIDAPEFSPEDSDLPERLDRWILAYLNARDDAGENLPLPDLFDRVSCFNAAITGRVIRDSINRLEHPGGQAPPLPFCWISMGSDARGEQVIRTDQDNALIYADPIPGREEEAASYFSALAEAVTQGLDRLGFALCRGNVMATNPQWCRSLGQWLSALDNWVGSTDPEAVRKLTILLDFKAVFGDNRLAATLQTRVFDNFEQHESASHFLVRDDRLFAPPKTRFNRIRTRREKGCSRCFNLKTQALAHIVNGARLFAVNHGIRIPATLRRLARLRDDGVLAGQDSEDYIRAFIFLTRLKLTAHLTGHETDQDLPDNCIDVAALDGDTREQLGIALDSVVRFQKQMAAAYNRAWMNYFN